MKPTEGPAPRPDLPNTDKDSQERHDAMMAKIRSGEKLEKLDEITPRYRQLLEQFLVGQARGELAVAYAFIPWIRQAPTLAEKVAMATVTRDEMNHANWIFQLLKQMDLDPTDLWVNIEWHTLSVLQRPVRSWGDFLALHLFMDSYADALLGEAVDCSWGPWSRVMQKIAKDELFHVSHSSRALEQLASNSQSKKQLQQSINFWFLHVNELFLRTSDEPEAMEYKLAFTTARQKHDLWYQQMQKTISSMGLELPPKTEVGSPMTAQDRFLLKGKRKLKKILLKLLT